MAILHLSDFDKYPKAIADDTTTNETWLRMASLLKGMGVKNYYFHLALHDPELQGVDPFQKNISAELVLRIQLELKYNPWYFFREVARLPNGNNPLQFRLSRPILALYWCIFNGISFSLVMPRQIGKTAAMVLMHNYLRDFKYRNLSTFLFTKDSTLRKSTVEDMKNVQHLYPLSISPIIKNGSGKDSDNYETVTCNRWGNSTVTDIGHAVLLAAENVARGGVYPFIHSDETAWTVNGHLSIPQMQFATGAARENAEQYNEVNCDVYTTTPGFLDTEHGKYAYALIMSGAYWNEVFYDAGNKDKAKEMIKASSPAGRCLVNGTFNHRQSGKDDDWLRKRIAQAITNVENIENNLLNKWSKGSLAMLLTKEQVDIITKSEEEPTYTAVSNAKYILDWYIPKNKINEIMSSGYFGLGLDTSQAVGVDANGLVITDFKDMSTVARSRVSEANLYVYAEWIVAILIAYPRVTLIIENKSSGQHMLDTIVVKLIAVGINPFKRIYNKVVDESITRKTEFAMIDSRWKEEETYNSVKGLFGISTNKDSRVFLYDTVIQHALNSTGHLVKDKILAEELRGLIVKNGRVDHTYKGHDDCVIGWLLNHWFIKHSKNLQYYGINVNYPLSLVADDGASLTMEELEQRTAISSIKLEIIKLKENIKESNSIIENLRDERILAIKVAELKKMGDTALSMDSILGEIREAKKNKGSLKNNILQMQRVRNSYTTGRPY